MIGASIEALIFPSPLHIKSSVDPDLFPLHGEVVAKYYHLGIT